MRKVPQVSGVFFHRPPIFQMSCSWCNAMITLPAPRNSRALKKACVVRWNIACVGPPKPTAITM